jgi:hypothetical protein
MRLFSLISLILFALLFTQCTKDRYDPNAPCIPHEALSVDKGYTHTPIFEAEPRQPHSFYFNPTNSDEIALIFWEKGSVGLWVYNLQTGHYRSMIDIDDGIYLLGDPAWSSNGWILLNVLDATGVFNLYKVHLNGTGMEQLTQDGNAVHPVIDITGEKIIYMVAGSSPATWLVIDEEGEVLDTTYLGPSDDNVSWQHSQYIANITSLGLMIADPYQNQFEVIYPVHSELDQSIESTVWLDEERIFWCFTTGVYITNIVTGETEVIRETCNARYYQRPTYAPDIDKIVLERCERIKDTETSGRFIVTPTMMNPDGSEEEVLEIEVD